MGKRIVVALGGNALGDTPSEQIKNIKEAACHIVDLIFSGYEIIITHGNGPQVGMVNLAFEEMSKTNEKIPKLALPECTAMSQGYIGFHLQNGIEQELKKRGSRQKAVTLITQVEVDKNDPAFETPTKPIGGYYTKEQIEKIKKNNPSFTYVEDSGRGYRKTVASPKPVDIIEKDSIMNLLDSGYIVIACGGGGIPVIKSKNGEYEGIDAVIDKDLASALLANLIGAEYFMILTSVEKVYLNFNKDAQKAIDRMSTKDAKAYCNEGQFAPGSMLPKIQAAINFVGNKKNKKALICSLNRVDNALNEKSGTYILN